MTKSVHGADVSGECARDKCAHHQRLAQTATIFFFSPAQMWVRKPFMCCLLIQAILSPHLSALRSKLANLPLR